MTTPTKIHRVDNRAELPTVTIVDGPKFAIEISNCNSAAQVIGILRIALREYEQMVVGDGNLRVVSILPTTANKHNHVIMESNHLQKGVNKDGK